MEWKRVDFKRWFQIPTRWMDNDVYGHVNNVVYYSFFDTVVNKFLMEERQLDYSKGKVVGLVVETKCQYFAPIAFPDVVVAGIKVAHIGTSSVRYEIGLFKNDEEKPAAEGHFVHVYVTRSSNKPTPLTSEMRSILEKIS